jgi:phosphate transport system permease protein
MSGFGTDMQRYRPIGEGWVWFTSLGLAVGLTMIVGLLALIAYRGIGVFWPQPVVQVELREGSAGAIGGATTLAGRVVKVQDKPTPGTARGDAGREWQLFVGNKDAYGFMFRYLDEADIVATSKPSGLYIAERLSFGDAIFFPQRLELASGMTLAAEDPAFAATLERYVREARERWEVIRRIERVRVGAINRRLEQLRLETRHLVGRDDLSPAEEERLAAAEQVRAKLESEFQVLAAEARDLRAAQEANRLHYRTPDGRERSIPVGEIVHVHRPNDLGFFGKTGLFVHRFWTFLSTEPREANTEGGIWPAIFGTFVMTLLMSVAVTPFGVLAAIYLREYARQGPFVRSVRIAVNNLAGVPSIVFGVFGLGFFVYFVGGTIDQLFYQLALPTPTFGTGGVLWASLTLALMTVPVVIVATEEALAAVSRGTREGSLACGASKWQTIQRIVLPAAAPGILTGLILAMARGAGEVAPLMLVGVVKLAPTLPVDSIPPFVHLERKFMHLGFHIFDLGFQSPDSEAAKPMVFATTFLLILLVIVLNLGAILIRNRLRRKYLASAF